MMSLQPPLFSQCLNVPSLFGLVETAENINCCKLYCKLMLS